MPRRLPPLATATAGWLAVVVIAILILHLSRAQSWDERLYDQLTTTLPGAPTPDLDPVVVVGIDNTFLSGIPEPLGLIHPYLARFFDAMRMANPSVVGLDVVLPAKRLDQLLDSSGKQYHQPLVQALYELNSEVPVVQIRNFDIGAGRYVEPLIDFRVAADNGRLPFSPPFPEALRAATALLCTDADGVVRHYPSHDCLPERGTTALSEHLLAWMQKKPVSAEGLLNVHRASAMGYVSLATVLEWQARGDTAALKRTFSNKAVLLGLILPWEDRVQIGAPLFAPEPDNRKVPGVYVHAQAIRDVMRGTLLHEPAHVWQWALVVMASLLWFVASIPLRLVAGLLFATGIIAGFFLLPRSGVFLPASAALLTLLLAIISRTLLDAWRNHREKQGLVHLFSGYVSPDVMQDILAGRLQPGLNAERRHLCILFSDIRSFTTMSESLPAEELVALLKRYFDRMAVAIHTHGGTLDKFIGDGIMAFFGAPQAHKNPEQAALDAAREMLVSLQELNIELVAEGRTPWAIGIGLHCGEVVVGHVGSQSRHEYTAIGDVVNVTARLEGITKEIGYPIACSAELCSRLPHERFQDAGTLPLKGHTPMQVFGWKP